jgi:hypothetical protein
MTTPEAGPRIGDVVRWKRRPLLQRRGCGHRSEIESDLPPETFLKRFVADVRGRSTKYGVRDVVTLRVLAGFSCVVAWLTGAMAQSSAPSGRHGDGHAEHNDWYEDRRQSDTGLRCCLFVSQ